MGYPLYVQVDLFFYREPEEAKQQEEEEAVPIPDYGLGDYSAPPLASDQWPVQGSDTQWNPDVQQPISAVPTTWATEPGKNYATLFCFVFCFFFYNFGLLENQVELLIELKRLCRKLLIWLAFVIFADMFY